MPLVPLPLAPDAKVTAKPTMFFVLAFHALNPVLPGGPELTLKPMPAYLLTPGVIAPIVPLRHIPFDVAFQGMTPVPWLVPPQLLVESLPSV